MMGRMNLLIDFRERIEVKPGHGNYLILPLPIFNTQRINLAINFAKHTYNINVSTSVLHINSDYDIDESHRQYTDNVAVFPLYFKLFDYTVDTVCVYNDIEIAVHVNENQTEKLIKFLKDFKTIDFYITYRIKDIMKKDDYTIFLQRFMREKEVTNLHIINPYR